MPEPYYCTSADVAQLLGRQNDFTTSTTPTKAQVEALIEKKEAIIDNRTSHVWNVGRAAVDNQQINTDEYEYDIGHGLRLRLRHRKIVTFSYAAGDRFDYWDGTQWSELFKTGDVLDTSVTIDYELGIVAVRGYSITGIRKARFRAIYRYGNEAATPKDVGEACAKLVALDIISNPFYNAIPQGTDRMGLAMMMDRWREDVDDIIFSRAEWTLIV